MSFGVEEEFVFLDPLTLSTTDVGGDAIAALADEAGAIVREFFRSQLEYASPVFVDTREAVAAVRAFRQRLEDWAHSIGVLAAATGTPFQTARGAQISRGDRYARIAEDIGVLTARHQINALHVHVGVDDRNAGVQIINKLRPWLPALVAISANSPFWHGEDTDFDSWRTIHMRRWTTHGVPPRFRDADHYAATVAALTGIGVTADEGTINWSIRLSRHHPTVEVRAFDAQLDAESSIALAAVVRALAASPRTWSDDVPHVLLDAGVWHAARNGIGSGILHPGDGRLHPTDEVIDDLRALIRPVVQSTRDEELTDAFFARLRITGTGATRQRNAYRSGADELAALFRAPRARSLSR